MATHLLNEVFRCSSPPTMPPPQPLLQPPPPPPTQQQPEKKPRPQPEQAVTCPRCDSTNTKFCYYNNYSLAQPRYFCKGCRRYWTKGGTLRNVPVGGGCRKNKRPSFSSKKAYEQSLATTSGAALHPLPPPPPSLTYGPGDLTLAFPALPKASFESKIGLEDRDSFLLESPGAHAVAPHVPGFLELLKTGFLDSSMAVFNSFCFGLGGHGNPQEAEGAVGIQPPVPPFEGLGGATAAAIKPESSYKGVEEDNRLFMGLQWPAGEAGNMVVDPVRDYWSGVGPSTWHGLVHSSLI